MQTKVFHNSIGDAPELIKAGGLVAVPTETVYGLAGNALDAVAVEKIYEVKGRPPVKPLSLMVPSPAAMESYAEVVPEEAKKLAEKFWPGPLTIVLPARDKIPPIVLAGGKTVGLRCPDHALTLAALQASGVPFAAPSANLSGAASPKTAQDVLSVFDGEIDAVIDGGECTLGLESTILDMSSLPYRILRRGALPEEEIADVLVAQMQVIGITGLTGSGKSSAMRALEASGALLMDCDALYHKLLKESEALKKDLKERFPSVVSGEEVDRKKLALQVFSDEQALADLNAISHRHIMIAVREALRRFAMEGGKLAVIDAVELFSSGADALCDYTVAVVASEETRRKRIMARDGISASDALKRIRAQKAEEYYRRRCTYVINNDGTEEALREKMNQLLKENYRHG